MGTSTKHRELSKGFSKNLMQLV